MYENACVMGGISYITLDVKCNCDICGAGDDYVPRAFSRCMYSSPQILNLYITLCRRLFLTLLKMQNISR